MKNKIILLKFSFLFMLPSTLFSFHRINVKNILRTTFAKKPNFISIARFSNSSKPFEPQKRARKTNRSLINYIKDSKDEKFISPHSEMIKLANKKRLSPLAYQIKAHEIISSMKSLKYDLSHDIKTFLQEQSQSFTKLEANELDVEDALTILNSTHLYQLLHIKNMEDDQTAMFLYQFSLKANELLSHRLRKILKIYVTELSDFEYEYASELTKVTQEEYNEVIAKLDNNLLVQILIEESSNLADYMLKKQNLRMLCHLEPKNNLIDKL